MASGIGQGIASGLTNAISLALQSKGLDIRRERTEALERAQGRQLDISQATLNLKRDAQVFANDAAMREPQLSIQERQASLERENQLKKTEFIEKQKEAARQIPSVDAKGYLQLRTKTEDGSNNHTIEQEIILQKFLETRLFSKMRNGLFSEADIDELLQSGFDIENPDISVTEFHIKMQNAGQKEAHEEVEVREQRLEKMKDKNELLKKGNQQAFKDDPEASELVQSITELKAAEKQFAIQGGEAEEIKRLKVEREKEKQIEDKNERERIIRDVIRAREGEEGGALSSRNATIRFAEAREKARKQAASQGITDPDEIEKLAGNLFAADMLEITLAQKVDPFKKAFDTKAGSEAGNLKIELEDQIVKATLSNQVIKRGLVLLDSKSGIFSGPLANIKTGFNKYVREFGFNLVGETVENTEAFAAVMARDVLNILGSGDLGAGTGISDNDRLFAAQIVGGAVTLDEGTIRKLLDLNTRVNQAKITVANRRLEQLRTQREASDPFAGTNVSTSDRTNGGGMTAEEFQALREGQ